MKVFNGFGNNWKQATIKDRIWFVITYSIGFIGSLILLFGHINYDKLTGIWVTDTKWIIGLVLYMIFSLSILLKGKVSLKK